MKRALIRIVKEKPLVIIDRYTVVRNEREIYERRNQMHTNNINESKFMRMKLIQHTNKKIKNI